MKNIEVFENFKIADNERNVESNEFFINYVLDNYEKGNYNKSLNKIVYNLFEEYGLFKKASNEYSESTIKPFLDYVSWPQSSKSSKLFFFSSEIKSDYVSNINKNERIKIEFLFDFYSFPCALYCRISNPYVTGVSRLKNYECPKTDKECKDLLDDIVSDIKIYVEKYVTPMELISSYGKKFFFENEDI
jgi:hypothetical protein